MFCIEERPLNSENILINNQADTTQLPEPIATAVGKILPARGIEVTDKGIRLTAYRTNSAGKRLAEIKANCGV